MLAFLKLLPLALSWWDVHCDYTDERPPVINHPYCIARFYDHGSYEQTLLCDRAGCVCFLNREETANYYKCGTIELTENKTRWLAQHCCFPIRVAENNYK